MKELLRELTELAAGHGKVYVNVQKKLREHGIDASIGAIRDFFSKDDAQTTKHLVKQLTKLGYDPELGWVGNEDFFRDIGVSKSDFMSVAKALGEMVYEPALKEESKEENKTQQIVRCPICKTVVPQDELEDHMEDHDEKRSVKKMKKVEEGNDESYYDPGTEGTTRRTVLNVRCPICKTLVPRDELEDHMEDHDEKRPVKKMRKMDENVVEEETKEEAAKRHITHFMNRLEKAFGIKTTREAVEFLIDGGESPASNKLLDELQKVGFDPSGDFVDNSEFFKKLGINKTQLDELIDAISESVVVEGKKHDSLTAGQKREMVDYVKDLVAAKHVKGDNTSVEEAFYVAMDNIAGLDTAPQSVRKLLVKELMGLYKGKK